MRLLYFVPWILLGNLAYSQTSDHVMQANVTASQVDRQCDIYGGGAPSQCKFRLHISAVIEDRRFELVDFNTSQEKHTKEEILLPGLYKARLVKDEHSKPYRSYRVYELEFPDGAKEQFTVVRQESDARESR